MIKSRSTLAIQPSRPRRIWLNAVGSQNGAAREEELRRSLPMCDLETGTKNRVVQRDPITGLGLLGREFDPLRECRSKSQSARDQGDRNPILGQGNLGEESNGFRRQFSVRCRGEYRNPTDLSGSDTKEPELDNLRPNNRPSKTIVRQASRDPIAGSGDFGREWDPIRKYAGRPKPLQQPAPVKDDRNPITGSGIPKSSTIELWHRPPDYPFREYLDKPLTRSNSVMVHNRHRANRNPLTGDGDSKPTTPRRFIKKTNPLTGENCSSFSVKPEERPQRSRAASGSSKGSNPLTGEGYNTSDSRPSTPRKPVNGGGGGTGNPLTGENCQSFDLSAEFRSKQSAEKGETKNPLTGENCASYDLSAESKSRQPTAATDRSNPVTGENVNSFDINQELRSDRGSDRGTAATTDAAAAAEEVTVAPAAEEVTVAPAAEEVTVAPAETAEGGYDDEETF